MYRSEPVFNYSPRILPKPLGGQFIMIPPPSRTNRQLSVRLSHDYYSASDAFGYEINDKISPTQSVVKTQFRFFTARS